MNHLAIVQQLARNADVFKVILSGKSTAEYTFKPRPDKWCMLEVICHLVDEEKEDFRVRVKYVLENPHNELPGFNPLEWVNSRKYIEQDFAAKVGEFYDQRKNSIEWLSSLRNPNWLNAHNHPKIGPRTAEFFLANWLAHDYIHIRQLNRLAFEYLQQQSEIDLAYAGNF